MPNYFFGSNESVASLRGALNRWQGTPFRQHTRVRGPGGGVDCINLAAAAMVETGVVPAAAVADLPDYSLVDGMHSDISALDDFLRSPAIRERLAVIDRDDPPVDGDLVVLRRWRSNHHITIVLDGALWHVPVGGTVGPWSLMSLRPAIMAIRRPLALPV